MTRRTGATLLVAALLAAGCGGDGEDGSTTRSTGPGAPPTTSARTTSTTGDQPSEQDIAAAQAPIVVEQPRPLDIVVLEFGLSGRADVHEGALAWELQDAERAVVKRGTMTASCGSGCVGKFATKVRLDGVPPTNYTLSVYSPNQSDEGPKRLHEVTVPLTVHQAP